MVGRRVIDKITPHEEPALGSAGGIDLRHARQDPGALALQNLVPIEVSAIRQDRHLARAGGLFRLSPMGTS